MDYQCKMINMQQLNVTPGGFIVPLCDSCKTRDCTNPIESMRVSILGVVKKFRMYNRGVEPRIVVECEGYIKK